MSTPDRDGRPGLREAVERLASRLLKFDVLNEQIPAHVDVPDDYEAGVNEAGRYLRALLAEHPATPAEDVDFIKRLVGAWDCCGTCAGGVLREHDAALTAKAKAAALREAADQLDRDGMKRLSARLVKQWLRERADRETP